MSDGILRLAVFGMTGAGKTSFINKATGAQLEVGGSGNSCTKDVQYGETTVNAKKVLLLDTPGFDDSGGRDADIFVEISKWLAVAEASGTSVDGVIIMQPINKPRVTDSEQKKTQLFKKIVGGAFYPKVAFGDVPTGAKVLRFENTERSARDVVLHFMGLNSNPYPRTRLLLQEELVQADGRLNDTSACRELDIMLGQKTRSFQVQINQGRVASTPELQGRVNDISKKRSWLKTIKINGKDLLKTFGKWAGGAVVSTALGLLCEVM
ncbi:Uu.00g124710.m01.CDS01 [Anthostomella pinea]|uniref:Uu.00g124710.m01.CDS01 n=1 Tax=Anthostomella pinea TaxID=933095 RepID=A0AAI8VCC0_9PEZI|nr:Uu.00g124710.m01.CDS01 [Anthostomella pinea]